MRTFFWKPPERPASFVLLIPYQKQKGNCSASLPNLRPPVSYQLLIQNNKQIAPEAFRTSGLQFPKNLLLKAIELRLTPYILSILSGASGLQFPYDLCLKTIRKLLRRPPERPASFFLSLPYFKQQENCSGSLRSLRLPFPINSSFKSNEDIVLEASGTSGFLCPINSLLKTKRKLLRKPSEPAASSFLSTPYSKQQGNGSASLPNLRPPVSYQLLIQNNKEMAPQAFRTSGLQFPKNLLLKAIELRLTPYILSILSGASGLQFPYDLCVKTIRKLLRRPPEPPASFFLSLPYFKQQGNYSGSLQNLRFPFSYKFFMKNNKKIAPEASGASGFLFS